MEGDRVPRNLELNETSVERSRGGTGYRYVLGVTLSLLTAFVLLVIPVFHSIIIHIFSAVVGAVVVLLAFFTFGWRYTEPGKRRGSL